MKEIESMFFDFTLKGMNQGYYNEEQAEEFARNMDFTGMPARIQTVGYVDDRPTRINECIVMHYVLGSDYYAFEYNTEQ